MFHFAVKTANIENTEHFFIICPGRDYLLHNVVYVKTMNIESHNKTSCTSDSQGDIKTLFRLSVELTLVIPRIGVGHSEIV